MLQQGRDLYIIIILSEKREHTYILCAHNLSYVHIDTIDNLHVENFMKLVVKFINFVKQSLTIIL